MYIWIREIVNPQNLVHNIKPPNYQSCFSQFFSVLAVEKENKLFVGTKQVFLIFEPKKSSFVFSTAQTEKISWKKLGKTRLVVWWFDVTNKVHITEKMQPYKLSKKIFKKIGRFSLNLGLVDRIWRILKAIKMWQNLSVELNQMGDFVIFLWAS